MPQFTNGGGGGGDTSDDDGQDLDIEEEPLSPEGTSATVEGGSTSPPESPDSGGMTTGPGPSGGPSTSSGNPTRTTSKSVGQGGGSSGGGSSGQDGDGTTSTSDPSGDDSTSTSDPEPTGPVSEDEARSSIESDLEAAVGRDLAEDEFTITKSGDSLVGELSPEVQLELAAEEIESDLETRTGLDLDLDEDFVVEESGDGFAGRLTEAGQERLLELRQRERRRDEGDALSVGESAVGFDVFFQGVPLLETQERQRSQADASSIDVGAVEAIGEARRRARERGQSQPSRADLEAGVETDLERQVGAARAEALGISNPRLRESVVESTDLERGRDFEIDVARSDDGLSIGASLTDEFRRSFAEETAEIRLERATGLDLEPGVDFQVVLAEDGSATPIFTDRGRGRVALSDLDRTVRDLEAGRIPVVTDLLGIRGPTVDLVGGEGPIAPDARSTEALESEQGEPLRDLEAEISGVADRARAGLRRGEGTLRSPFTGEPFLGQSTLEPLVAGGLRGGVDLLEAGATLPLRGADVLLAGNEAVDEDIDRLLSGEAPRASERFAGQASAAGARLPFVAASGLIGEVRENPLRTTGALAGSLGVSAAAMRLLPASRFAIQPGEEVLGIGGNRLTRRVAGERTAERLFPDNEPLIFSEEFVIRRARDLRDRLAGETEIEARPVTTDPNLPADRPALLSTEAVDAAMGVSGPSRIDLARGRARRGAASARESVGDLVESVNIRTGRIGAGFGSVEIEIEAESEGDLVRDFDPSRSEVLGGGASERAREQMVERQKEARRMMGGDFEGVRDPLGEAERRREAAERPEVGLEEDALSRASIRSELALAPASTLPRTSLGVLAAARARLDQRAGLAEDLDLGLEADLGFDSLLDLALEADLESEFETDLETEADLETELETETDLETDLESEILAEAETEAELELELRPGELNLEAELDPDDRSGDRRSRDPLAPVGLGIGTTTEGDLLPGFVSETIADIALTGRRSGRAPPEDVLEGILESGEAPLEELPTFEEALGTEAEREAIEETRELFGFDLGGIRL